MLVLTRKVSESIRIADGIEIMVVAIQGGQVRLGINCPREIPIHRHEVQQRRGVLETQKLQQPTNCQAEISEQKVCLHR